MQGLDLLALAGYFLVLIAIGWRVLRRHRGDHATESFLAANRDADLVQTTASTAATDLGGGFSLALGGLGFTLGLAGSWLLAVSAASVVLAGLLLVPRLKPWLDRSGALTTGDLFRARFDRRTGQLAALVIALAWFTFVGAQIIAGGKLLQATTGLDLQLGVLLAGTIIIAYTAMGGLKAVILTDVMQMGVLFVGIVLIAVPVGWWRIGGWDGLVVGLAEADASHLLDWGAAGWPQIVAWLLAVFPVWFISIAALQRVIAARDTATARRAFVLTGVPIEWPLFAIGATLMGLFARVLLPDLSDPELATPLVILELLPAGLAGIVIAAYVAAVMSTADSCLIGPVAIATQDGYARLRPNAGPAQRLRVARILTVGLGALATGLALLVPNVLDLILYAYTFGAAGLFLPMLGLLFWRRTTAAGAFTSMLGGGSTAIVWSLLGEPWGWAAAYPGWGIAALLLVAVSLATDHSAEEQPDLLARPPHPS